MICITLHSNNNFHYYTSQKRETPSLVHFYHLHYFSLSGFDYLPANCCDRHTNLASLACNYLRCSAVSHFRNYHIVCDRAISTLRSPSVISPKRHAIGGALKIPEARAGSGDLGYHPMFPALGSYRRPPVAAHDQSQN